jgi:hypothetical protein
MGKTAEVKSDEGRKWEKWIKENEWIYGFFGRSFKSGLIVPHFPFKTQTDA